MAPDLPNQTLLSGPAAGVVSGVELAKLAGREHVVTFDTGGTSTDISVVAGGRIDETSQGRIAGQDIGTPMLAVRTLGAGGGGGYGDPFSRPIDLVLRDVRDGYVSPAAAERDDGVVIDEGGEVDETATAGRRSRH